MNVADNEAFQAIIICTLGRSIVEKINVIDNIEYGQKAEYMGAFSTALAGSKMTVIGCYVKCNSGYLSYPINGQIEYVGCCLDSQRCSGDVSFYWPSLYDNIQMTLLSSAGIRAAIPYREYESLQSSIHFKKSIVLIFHFVLKI